MGEQEILGFSVTDCVKSIVINPEYFNYLGHKILCQFFKEKISRLFCKQIKKNNNDNKINLY